ncbi:TIR domain-containing protein [Paenibacillus typhae]|uniref:TIR domain-containing protein n=1 Tax=Paenibacillus typhae TaxID=1174501 RepID=UPI001C8DBDB5|nr:TIR domain-containing protein [Paenibacillus typhae]MBY0010813.1 TIR domain-containing protein [Paenibacillus typhae]
MNIKHNQGIIINGGTINGNVTSIGSVNYSQDASDDVNEKRDLRYKYDIALSFAGEDRSYVEIIAGELRASGINLFYDEFEQISLWGKDLSIYLDKLFRNEAAFCVMFISVAYMNKSWCVLERDSAMNRQRKGGEYILPIILDQTTIPSITDRYGYLEAKHYSPVQLAEMIIKKLRNT